jgi:hypothetical protein
MTREEQLWTTMEWIHNNVEYAYVQNGAWAQITNKTYVDAVFTYRKGQCKSILFVHGKQGHVKRS